MIISVQNGCFGYGNGLKLFQNVSFELPNGEVLAILGPNGTGKTTFLRCMMGLLKWQAGETKLSGVGLEKIPHRERWKTIGYVPQARGRAATYTVKDMVLLGRGAFVGSLSTPKVRDLEIAKEAISRVGIDHLAKRLCTELSGGELQLVFIARAIAAEPKILILDEPESNLDFKNQLLILDLIRRLARECGIACIINTHYPEHALRIANKALLLNRYAGHAFGAAETVITEQSLESLFGVRVKIGEIRTGHNSYKVVFPISIVQEPEPHSRIG